MKKIISLFMLFVFPFTGVINAENLKDLTYFLNRLAGEDTWLEPLPDEKTYMASSYQPTEPRDCNAFSYIEKDNGKEWKVLVDIKGAGLISRFWTAGNFDGGLQIIVDDHPVVTTTLRKFFDGQVEPFGPPLVFGTQQSSGGRVSYFPIPFSKRIKIRSEAEAQSFYWQINYSLFTDSHIKSFSANLSDQEKTALKFVSDRLVSFADPNLKNYNQQTWTFNLEPGGKAIKHIPGKGVVRSLHVTMNRDDWYMAKDLNLQIHYDGNQNPSVNVGLLDLIHLGSKLRKFDSRYGSFDENTMSFRMPMPFQDGLTLTIANPTKQSLSNINIIFFIDIEMDKDITSRFHACTYRETVKYGELLTLSHIQGEGVFAGLNLITQAPGSIGLFFNQEGNEYIQVDGESVWNGTGTEDFFNCGYYYSAGETALPLHGCLDKRKEGFASTGLTEFMRKKSLKNVNAPESDVVIMESDNISINLWTQNSMSQPPGFPFEFSARSEECGMFYLPGIKQYLQHPTGETVSQFKSAIEQKIPKDIGDYYLTVSSSHGGIISAYRILKLDAVPFKKNILVTLEPGCPKKGKKYIGEVDMFYGWTCFWYLKH